MRKLIASLVVSLGLLLLAAIAVSADTIGPVQ
jgi:hypothetical protein